MLATLSSVRLPLENKTTPSPRPTPGTGTDACPHMRDLRTATTSWPRTVTAPHVFSPMPAAGLPVIRRSTSGNTPEPRPVAGTCGSTQNGRGEG
ncbi:hypothetical protein Sgou_62050 [Streptomyces gougerotii]|uniref:Uncharacterized protein n=1 Tax=Streptomyces gougerotii TaxID=53448 RepID=A0ABQ1DG35_9ACTN|nr:hypothetical protein Sgou_62050 [Streptomyces gougerotii]